MTKWRELFKAKCAAYYGKTKVAEFLYLKFLSQVKTALKHILMYFNVRTFAGFPNYRETLAIFGTLP